MTIRHIKAAELQPDISNANKGTERGRALLEQSLRQYGAGRSILVDKFGRIIAGNKTLETAAEIGLDDVVLVQTDGKQIVAVQRMDLDLANDEQARMLAYADNRVGQIDLDFDAEQLFADMQAGFPLTDFWRQDELDRLMAELMPPIDPATEWQGMPEFEHEDLTAFQSIHVHFKTQDDVDAFAKLVGQKLTEKTRYLWFPQAEITRYADKRYADES